MDVMARFEQRLKANVSDRPMFVADNNGFDWQCDGRPKRS
jgi:hypothetical protein